MAKPGDLIGLTVAAGKPVVTDSTAATMTIIGPAGASRTVALPASVKQTAPPVPLVPGTTPGSTVPLVVPSVNQLVVVDTVAGRPTAVTLGVGAGDTLDPPQPFGQRIYIPDETTGSLIVYDTATGRLLPPIIVTGHTGPLDVFVNAGMLWANDPNGPAAVAVNPAGGVLDIGKYRPRLPGGHPKPSTAGPQSAPAPVTGTAPGSPPPASTGSAPASVPPSRSPSATPSPSGSTSASPSPSPTGTPQPPGAPTASSGNGVITVTFTPSSGATPLDYTLIGAPSGATVTPASVPAGGPFSFTVSGLDCAQTYAFAVAANYSGAGGSLQSPMTAAMRPCVAPSAPQSPSVTATANHIMTLGWSAPASPGGGAVSYTVSWSGLVSGSAANLTGTSYQITGLQNSQTYSYTVTAVSPAGSSQPATGSQALTPPPQALNFHNNNSCTSLLNVRASPTQSSQSLAQVPGCTPVGGTGVAVTVYCQVTGSTATDNLDPSLSGDIWDSVTWNGINGWVNDIYIDTPQSNARNFNAYSDPPLWQCS